MTITQAMCKSFKTDMLNGVHQPGDTYKLALYTSSASLDADTAAYTSTGEASGTGYTAGGATLSGFSVTNPSGAGRLDFTTPTWPSSTISNVVGALLYNSSRSNKAIAVFSFSAISSSGSTLTLNMPTVGDSTSLVRVG